MISSDEGALLLLTKWRSEMTPLVLSFTGNSVSLKLEGYVSLATMRNVTVSTRDRKTSFTFVLQHAKVVLSDPEHAEVEVKDHPMLRPLDLVLTIKLPIGAIPNSPAQAGDVVIATLRDDS